MRFLPKKKTSSSVNPKLAKAIKTYAKDHNDLSKADKQQLDSAVDELQQFCRNAHAISDGLYGDAQETDVDVLTQYVSLTVALERVIPFGDPEKSGLLRKSSTVTVEFQYQNAFGKRSSKSTSIAYERACTLFNLASTYTIVASKLNRNDFDESKRATQLYLKGAGIYQHLEENSEIYTFPGTPDLTSAMFRFGREFSVAQSAASTFETAVGKKMKSKVITMLAKGASELFESCRTIVENEVVLQSYFAKIKYDWNKYLMYQMMCFDAASLFYASKLANEKDEIGEEIGCINYALHICQEAAKFEPKNRNMEESRLQLMSVMQSRLPEAEHDNMMIYALQVPPPNELQPIASRVIGEPIEFIAEPYDLPNILRFGNYDDEKFYA